MTRLRSLGARVATVDARRVRPAPKRAAAFYLTAAWRALVERLIEERGRRCERCGRTGCRIFGDHMVELEDGGEPLEPSNVQLLCGSCHTTKTAASRAARIPAPARG